MAYYRFDLDKSHQNFLVILCFKLIIAVFFSNLITFNLMFKKIEKK
jgi:hypothetical protein